MKVKEASNFFWMAQIVCITECVILSYHTPLQLNVYGQAHQISEMVPPHSTLAHQHSLSPVPGLKTRSIKTQGKLRINNCNGSNILNELGEVKSSSYILQNDVMHWYLTHVYHRKPRQYSQQPSAGQWLGEISTVGHSKMPISTQIYTFPGSLSLEKS